MKKVKAKKAIKLKKPAFKITAQSNIFEVVQKYPKTIDVFQKYGFHCVGCALAQYEDLAQGAAVHGIDINKLLKDLNKAIK